MQTYKCQLCGEQFQGESAAPGPVICPRCGGPPPFAPMLVLSPATATSSASMKLTTDQVLDAQRLTVLGLLLTLGLSVGLALGFGIKGWLGIGAGIVAAVAVPFTLALAFRRRRTRSWLAKLADWATERPNLRH